MKKKISLDEQTMLGAYNHAQPWARRLCTYKLEKINEDHYRREQFINLPIYFLLFIPVSIIQAMQCMWDGGLKKFEWPALANTMMSRRKCEIMNIVKKEIIVFNKEERKAINLLLKICNEIRGATSDSNLEKLAKETYNNVATLRGYEDDEEEEEDKK